MAWSDAGSSSVRARCRVIGGASPCASRLPGRRCTGCCTSAPSRASTACWRKRRPTSVRPWGRGSRRWNADCNAPGAAGRRSATEGDYLAFRTTSTSPADRTPDTERDPGADRVAEPLGQVAPTEALALAPAPLPSSAASPGGRLGAALLRVYPALGLDTFRILRRGMLPSNLAWQMSTVTTGYAAFIVTESAT